MFRAIGLGLFLLLLAGCGGGEVVLDCGAYCARAACTGTGVDTCDEDCRCFDTMMRSEIKVSFNECGSKPTCGEQDTCFDQQPDVEPRPIDEEVRVSCADFALRCALDAQTECSFWALDNGSGIQTLLDEALLELWIDCYDRSCDQVDSCIDGIQSPACR